MYDIVIIGAGPAGLFAAIELVERGQKNILIVDKGRDIIDRKCPSTSSYSRCFKCNPCNILCGLGGAGGLSDGKLNLKSDIGGNLEEFVPKEEAESLVTRIDNIFLQHGASPKLYGKNVKELELKAASHGIEFIPIPQRHIGSDMLPSVIISIKQYLEERGVSFKLQTDVLKIECTDHFTIHLENEQKIESQFLIAATGRSGADWLSEEAKKLNIKTKYAPIDIGVRIEVPAVVMNNIIEYAWRIGPPPSRRA